MLSRSCSATRSSPVRRACRRSSAAIVCRLFFTRWWISWIIAVLILSSCSLRSSSVTSSIATIAPVGSHGAAQAAREAAALGGHERDDALDPDQVVLLDALLEADAALHRFEADVLVGLELLELGLDQVVGVAEAPVQVLGGCAQILDATGRVDDHDAVVDAEPAEPFAAAHAAGDDQVARAGDGAAEGDVAFALPLVLDQQHLAAQGTDDLAALVLDREDLLEHGRAANDGAVDDAARPVAEQHAEDVGRLVAADRGRGQRPAVQAGHRHRLRLSHEHGVAAGAGEQGDVGASQVGEQRQVGGNAGHDRALLAAQRRAAVEVGRGRVRGFDGSGRQGHGVSPQCVAAKSRLPRPASTPVPPHMVGSRICVNWVPVTSSTPQARTANIASPTP